MNKDLISVGKILNFHGINGEMKVGYTRNTEKQISSAKVIYIFKDNKPIALHVTSVRFHKNNALIKVKEINSINEVMEYKDFKIFIKKEIIDGLLEEDEFLVNNLIGLDAFDLKGKRLGVVSEVFEQVNGCCLELITEGGKSSLVPFVKDLVPTVDIKNKKVIINNIEGLVN